MKEIALGYLRQALGNPEAQFRDGQFEAIDAVVSQNRRALVVQSTSWGKSMVYFIATKILRNAGRGPTIVISPLLALMRNQVEAAAKIGINAVTFNSQNDNEHPTIIAAVTQNQVDLLLLSPEKLSGQEFIKDVLGPVSGNMGMLVIDEAHCISDWGHDFRPAYRRIARVLERLPENIPVLATTATANNRVVEDVSKQLGEDVFLQRGPLIRSSISLDCIRIDDVSNRLAWLADKIQSIEGSGIVYVQTQKATERVSEWLTSQGINAKSYHGGLKEGREGLEQELINNDVKCLVATSALGMGFDKPDLTFVIHYQAPRSIVSYYQEVGRAGRSIDSAEGILLYGDSDENIHEFFRNTATPKERDISIVLDFLEGVDYAVEKVMFADINLRKSTILNVLKYLEALDSAPVMKNVGKWSRTASPYVYDNARIESIKRIREQEWRELLEYGEKQKCLGLFLAEKLEDPNPIECGRCSVCTEEYASVSDCSNETLASAVTFVGQSEIVLETRKQFPNSALANQHGTIYTIPIPNQMQPGKILSQYGEPPIGELVREGKIEGKFSERISDFAADLIRNRWDASEGVKWITCIPSKRHPDLVPKFAMQLAEKLNLPFVGAISKIRETDPQKNMETKWRQVSNLVDAFSCDVPEEFENAPVLLIDDMADSRWTLAIATILLTKEGSGPVFPLALASSATKD